MLPVGVEIHFTAEHNRAVRQTRARLDYDANDSDFAITDIQFFDGVAAALAVEQFAVD